MVIPIKQRWVKAATLFGILYGLVGITFGLLVWRLAAWVVSAALFTAHIWYEHSRLRNSRSPSALHVSAAVALGALIIAGAANVHELSTASSYRSSLALALVAWPALTGVPAFVAALIGSWLLARIRPNT